MPDYGMSWKTLQDLENFSAKIEVLENTIDLLHALIWGGIVEGDEKAVDRAGALVETLLEIASKRNQELNRIIEKINPLEVPDLVSAYACED